MTALERAFYEQAKTGFEEFYLVYQPIAVSYTHLVGCVILMNESMK